MNWHYIFGILAGVITIPTIAIYLRSIIKGETKPNRSSWVIWNITNVIIFASYYAVGARSTLILPFIYLFSASSTLILSYWYGDKSIWSKLDKISLLVCLASLLVWVITENPLTALLMVLAMDAVGYLPTIRKSFTDPASENHLYWILILLSSIVNFFALSSLSFGIIIYPISIFIMNVAVVLALYWRKIFTLNP